jgi:hypothetical protein
MSDQIAHSRFAVFLDDSRFSDLVIKCGTLSLNVHRIIQAQRSPILAGRLMVGISRIIVRNDRDRPDILGEHTRYHGPRR